MLSFLFCVSFALVLLVCCTSLENQTWVLTLARKGFADWIISLTQCPLNLGVLCGATVHSNCSDTLFLQVFTPGQLLSYSLQRVPCLYSCLCCWEENIREEVTGTWIVWGGEGSLMIVCWVCASFSSSFVATKVFPESGYYSIVIRTL